MRRVPQVLLIAMAATVAACGQSTGEQRTVTQGGIATERGIADQAVTMAVVDGAPVIVNGMAGDPPTLEVTTGNGAFRLDEKIPLVGVQAWSWQRSLVITGTQCPGFDPTSALGTAGEDCGGTNGSIVLFHADTKTFDVLARTVANEWAPGPVYDDRLILNGGRSEIDLRSGDIVDRKAYPPVGGLPCVTDAGLLLAEVDQGDIQQPGGPPPWRTQVLLRTGTMEDWTEVASEQLFGVVKDAAAAGIAGCVTEGPLLWVFSNAQVSTYVVQIDGDVLGVRPFAEPVAVDSPPIVNIASNSEWVAVTPLAPSQQTDPMQSALLSNGKGWSNLTWQGGPLAAMKFLPQNDLQVVFVVAEADHGWAVQTGALQ